MNIGNMRAQLLRMMALLKSPMKQKADMGSTD